METPQVINERGTYITGPKEIHVTICFYSPWFSVKTKLCIKRSQHYLTNPCNDIFHVTLCTNKEVLDIILEIYNNKISRPNSISLMILKTTQHTIANHLCQIFILSFNMDIFPECLKVANVTPVFKRGSKLDCWNFRLISLLSYRDKIIEKLTQKRIIS